jgi:hypothetical protein
MRRAVELMTTWSESGDGDSFFATQLAAQDLAGALANDMLLDESTTLITGLMSLTRDLLLQLENATGTPLATLLKLAGEQSADCYAAGR